MQNKFDLRRLFGDRSPRLPANGQPLNGQPLHAPVTPIPLRRKTHPLAHVDGRSLCEASPVQGRASATAAWARCRIVDYLQAVRSSKLTHVPERVTAELRLSRGLFGWSVIYEDFTREVTLVAAHLTQNEAEAYALFRYYADMHTSLRIPRHAPRGIPFMRGAA